MKRTEHDTPARIQVPIFLPPPPGQFLRYQRQATLQGFYDFLVPRIAALSCHQIPSTFLFPTSWICEYYPLAKGKGTILWLTRM
jgi:hypothetical protein